MTRRKPADKDLGDAPALPCDVARAALEAAGCPLAVLDRDWRFRYVSSGAGELLGHEPSELIGRRMRDVYPDIAGHNAPELEAAWESDEPITFRHTWPEIADRTFEMTAVRMDDLLAVSFMDVTAAARAEAALAESERHYRMLFEDNPLPVFVTDSKTHAFLAVNDTAVRVYGYSKSEFLRMAVPDIHPAEVREDLHSAIHAQRTRHRMTGVWPHVKKDGSVMQVGITTNEITWNGHPARLVLANDVTAEMDARRSLEESEQRYRNLMGAVPVAVLVHRGGRILYANQAAANLAGVASSEDLVGRAVMDFVHPDSREIVRERVAAVTRGGTPLPTIHETLLDDDGTPFEAEVSSAPVLLDGEPAAQLVIRDITEQVRAERLREDFLAMVSHDLRSPLTSLLGFCDLLRRPEVRTDTATCDRVLRRMTARANDMGRMIDDLMETSRIQTGALELELAEADLGVLAHKEMDAITAPGDIELQLKVSPRLGRIRCDANRMRHVIANLLSNAVKYSPDGGTVTLSVRPEGRWAVIEVSDQGVGIAEKDLPLLFERFSRAVASRARKAEGFGMGLFIVKQLVDAHGGKVSVKSVPGEGSTFTVRLPR